MHLDLDFLFLGLLGFWHTDGQDSLVKFRVNRICLDKGRQLYPPLKCSSVPFHKEVMLIFLYIKNKYSFFALSKD